MDITYEFIVRKGAHLVGIGEYVEVWTYNQYCVVFEDGENLGGFLRNGADDWVLIERAIAFYSKSISPGRVKH